MAPQRNSSNRERGFTYMGLLMAIAIIGIGLTAASEVWVTTARRQKMAELEWVGAQFQQAIGSYYESSPGSVKVYPAGVDDLLEDRRYLSMRRHLRAVYLNPFTGKADWEWVLAAGGGLRGVRVQVTTGSSVEMKEFFHPTIPPKPQD